MLTNWQKQIITGTVLGGSSLVKPPKGLNYYLSMRSNNELWLRYKIEELASIFPNRTLYKSGPTFRCNSRCDPELTLLAQTLYKKEKRHISMQVLNPLMDIGIAIWMLDNGGKTGRNKKNAYLNVTKFGAKGAKTIEQYFNEIDLNCAINRNKHRLRVLFTVPATIQLMKLIGHRIPVFVYDWLGLRVD